MAGGVHLTLELVRIKSPEERAISSNGLSFVFPKKGVGKYLSGPVVRTLFPGDVVVFSGTKAARICATDTLETLFWIFSASLEHLFPLLGSNEICRLQQIENAFQLPKCYPAATPLASECHRLLAEVPTRFDLGHRVQLLRVAAVILAAEFKTLCVRHDGYVGVEEHITQVFDTLSVADISSLSVGELANRFGCSRRHLNRLFHRHFGFSVSGLRMEMRLLKAVSLLRDPAKKVINVAEECGFNHLGLFNTCFKRRFNTTPGLWRKKAAAHDGIPEAVFDDPACRIRALGLCPWSGESEPERSTPGGELLRAPHLRAGSDERRAPMELCGVPRDRVPNGGAPGLGRYP